MTDKKVSQLLKEFGLTDDQILNIATCQTLLRGIDLLKDYIKDKWEMDVVTAMLTVKKLKEEFE